MSPDTCKFGHVFEVYDHDETGHAGGEDAKELRRKIRSGEIDSLDDLEAEVGSDDLMAALGDHYKRLKVTAHSQGTPYMVSWACADKFDEDLDYIVKKSDESIFVSPQNQLHDEFMQRKQQAEQRVRETMRNISELRKQKHMLEHDIRKLRSRAESFETGDETELKGDFIELVDGAGGAGQGADEASLKFYRDNHIFPSIVADFNEMDSLDDLKGDGKLSNLPANEKAVLKKKYVMYEKWKDLYGSEVKRKLNELKSELRQIERSIEQTQEWLEPYVKDVVMIHGKSTDELAADTSMYTHIRGTATMLRELEFVCYRPLKNTGEDMVVVKDNNLDEATHFRIVHINSIHFNFASGENPNSPAQGPSAAIIEYYPAIVCRHVFEKIFEEKIEKNANRFRELLQDYTGDFETEQGNRIRQAREAKNWSVRKLRNEVGEELGEEPPIELSSMIRRVEDGLDMPDAIAEEFGEDYLEAIQELLDLEVETSNPQKSEMYHGIGKTLREFTGQVDEYVVPEDADPLFELLMEIKFKYYYDFKLGLGMHTMK